MNRKMFRIALLPTGEGEGKMCWFVIPETELEQRFITLFAHENDLPTATTEGKECLIFPSANDPEILKDNIKTAYREFVKSSGYVEIPRLVGKSLSRAKEDLLKSGIPWVVEDEKCILSKPDGEIIFQRPSPGITIIPNAVIYLTVNRRKSK